AINASRRPHGITASISARNCSRRVTLPFWLHAIPANVRCSPILNLPTPSLDALLFYHVERLTQSFPRRCGGVFAPLPCGESPARHRYAVERDGQGDGEAGEETGRLCQPRRQRTGRAGQDHEPCAGQLYPALPVLHPAGRWVATHSR